ncbi:hypothetical protein I553_4039 [Mycobacterium xenopi 4042]|uniref:Uncharacterized protein n=1 Tax=Mycobacterium xenopi 4042 TaxID=1299334 RepID=X7YP93_MYCXE|nr:hypothetical protein I553_4039 [Mycobacterium xenopi 4042]
MMRRIGRLWQGDFDIRCSGAECGDSCGWVLDDAVVTSLTRSVLMRFAGKVDAAWNLHELTGIWVCRRL